MFRRGISILAIVGLLASQAAVIPHAHAGLSPEQQRQHDATTHVHCGGSGHHHHGHSHSHGGHGHGHEGADQHNAESLPIGLNPQNHDASAVRLPDLATARTAGGNTSPASVFLAIALVPAFGSDSFADTSREMARRLGHPPDIVFDASDTYLKLRNLRI